MHCRTLVGWLHAEAENFDVSAARISVWAAQPALTLRPFSPSRTGRSRVCRAMRWKCPHPERALRPHAGPAIFSPHRDGHHSRQRDALQPTFLGAARDAVDYGPDVGCWIRGDTRVPIQTSTFAQALGECGAPPQLL